MRKNSTILGLTACFFGWLGLHNWYLGQKLRALGHLILTLICFGLIFTAVELGTSAADVALGSSDRVLSLGIAATTALGALALLILGYTVGIINAAWGFVEGVLIITRSSATRRHIASGTVYLSPRRVPNQKATQLPQPYSQPAPYQTSLQAATPLRPAPQSSHRPPRAPKRPLLIGGIIAGVVLLSALILAIIAALFAQPDYSESFYYVNQLQSRIDTFYQDYSCNRVVDYVNSTWYSEKIYDSYVEDCKAVFDGTDRLVAALGNTSGIQYDSELSALFQEFKDQYYAAAPEQFQFERQLELYRAWHTFTVQIDDLTPMSSDAAFSAAAARLINSGDDTIAEYGQGWLDKTLDYAHAYQTYQAYQAHADSDDRLYEVMLEKQSAQRAWVSSHRPDIVKLVGLEFNNTVQLYRSFCNLYDVIHDAYLQIPASAPDTTYNNQVVML